MTNSYRVKIEEVDELESLQLNSKLTVKQQKVNYL